MAERARQLGMEPAEVLATVLRCTYRPRVGRAVAFGLPASKHFRIEYNYWAGDELRAGEMWTEKPIPQGSVFPIKIDLERPGRLWKGDDGELPVAARLRGRGLLLVGVAGSVVLSLGWLLVLRGCQ